jgi:hypothetical protein
MAPGTEGLPLVVQADRGGSGLHRRLPLRGGRGQLGPESPLDRWTPLQGLGRSRLTPPLVTVLASSEVGRLVPGSDSTCSRSHFGNP